MMNLLYIDLHDCEEAVLARQESESDDCTTCEYVEKCRNFEDFICPWAITN